MPQKYRFSIILLALILLLYGLHRTSYYIARNSLHRTFPELVGAPVRGGGSLAKRPGPGLRVAWLFNYYQRFDLPSRGALCETAQMWVSLTGEILQTSPRGSGVNEWIQCVRLNAS
jgi:hypothetical protein